MTSILPIRTTDLGPGEIEHPTAPRLISGAPVLTSWNQVSAFGGKVDIGVWQATPGEQRSVKDGICEYCHILEGVVELIAEDGSSQTFRAGDSFVMQPGFRGVWRTIETVRKIYVIIAE